MYKCVNMCKCANVQMHKCLLFTVHVIKRISKIPYYETKIES